MSEPMKGECYMCGRESDNCRHYPNLYTHGSEGTTLCQMCQNFVCTVIRDVSTRCFSAHMDGFRAATKGG